MIPFFTALVLAQQANRVPTLTGNIETIPAFESTVLGNKRNLIVYLPPQYKSEPNRRFPVLYMHDGQNIFDGATSYMPGGEWRADEAAEALINAGMIEPIIIVGIDNAGADRANEYLPWKIKLGNSDQGGKADLYGKMLTEEIMPMVNSKYRTKPDAANTGVLGSSFGGVISCYLGVTYPQKFSKVGIVSPSVWVKDRELLRFVSAPPKGVKRPKVWIDMGTKEGGPSVKNAQDLFDAYVKLGWKPNREIVCVIDGGAEHNELAWSRRMMSILTYFFGK